MIPRSQAIRKTAPTGSPIIKARITLLRFLCAVVGCSLRSLTLISRYDGSGFFGYGNMAQFSLTSLLISADQRTSTRCGQITRDQIQRESDPSLHGPGEVVGPIRYDRVLKVFDSALMAALLMLGSEERRRWRPRQLTLLIP